MYAKIFGVCVSREVPSRTTSIAVGFSQVRLSKTRCDKPRFSAMYRVLRVGVRSTQEKATGYTAAVAVYDE